MWSLLLLQLAPLLPPAPELPPADEDSLDILSLVVHQDFWPQEDLESWAPKTLEDNRLLAAAIKKADLPTLRFLSLAGSGCQADSPLGQALYRAACQLLPEAEALACLLAPTPPTATQAPALAWLALSSDRPLSLRAAALGRLLEAGYPGAWPLARAVLLTGTAEDDTAMPFATWTRNGRYELPKRLLLQSLRLRLEASNTAVPAFEPNGPWAQQVAQLSALEKVLLPALEQCSRAPAETPSLPILEGPAALGQERMAALRAILSADNE